LQQEEQQQEQRQPSMLPNMHMGGSTRWWEELEGEQEEGDEDWEQLDEGEVRGGGMCACSQACAFEVTCSRAGLACTAHGLQA